ncbi:MAG: Gfo/Idh/MocA family oxidoreductase [Planctomycetes bacterium]|nr:Gfo/Idh/MocA family oxidoreductase [Planctomycetota bacterium]
MKPITFAVVGGGWRCEFFLRIARALPERFSVSGVVVRDAAKGKELEKAWCVKTFRSIDSMLAVTSPSFVVTSVSWAANPEVVCELVNRRVPVLSETPPATSLEEMTKLYKTVSENVGKVQVAEQVHLRPQHQAQLALAESGRLGTVTLAQMSVSHGYHGISVMRKFLKDRFECPVVRGFAFTAPIVKSSSRVGPAESEVMGASTQDFYCFDYEGRFGMIDFTGDQYFGWIRNDRLLVRGERGEIQNNDCYYIKDMSNPLMVPLLRKSGGVEGNLEGHSLRGIMFGEDFIYRNQFFPAALSDDEIAIADALVRMDKYIETGEEFYSLADACQDRYLNIVAEEAVRTGTAIKTEKQVWAK